MSRRSRSIADERASVSLHSTQPGILTLFKTVKSIPIAIAYDEMAARGEAHLDYDRRARMESRLTKYRKLSFDVDWT